MEKDVFNSSEARTRIQKLACARPGVIRERKSIANVLLEMGGCWVLLHRTLLHQAPISWPSILETSACRKVVPSLLKEYG